PTIISSRAAAALDTWTPPAKHWPCGIAPAASDLRPNCFPPSDKDVTCYDQVGYFRIPLMQARGPMAANSKLTVIAGWPMVVQTIALSGGIKDAQRFRSRLFKIGSRW